jgi:hypothetical protein
MASSKPTLKSGVFRTQAPKGAPGVVVVLLVVNTPVTPGPVAAINFVPATVHAPQERKKLKAALAEGAMSRERIVVAVNCIIVF